MKQRTRYSYYTVCVTALCLTTVACQKEREKESFYPDVPMSVQMFSRGNVGETGSTARLLFWNEEHLPEISTGGTPYYECNLPESINDYSEEATVFKTGRYYPQLNTRVYALGFAPSDLEQVDVNNYSAYYLPVRNGMDTTVLASNSIVGSSVYVFRDPMEFCPATTQFVFQAIRSKNMENNLYVRNITIEMPHDAVPNILKWDDDDLCYKAVHDNNLDREDNEKGKIIDNPIDYIGNQLRVDAYAELGVRYLALPAGAESLNGIVVRAELSYLQDFPQGDETVTWYREWPDKANREEELAIPLRDTKGNPVTRVKPGESYLVTITFDHDAFTITAEQQDWIQGGKIPIPIIP